MSSKMKLEKKLSQLRAWLTGTEDRVAGEGPARVEEPPFTPFDLSALRSPRSVVHPALVAAESPRQPATVAEPATLSELGVPEELAQKFEATFRAMGATAGGQVVGFRFRTPGGASRPIRLDDAA